jgi:hypothetical protein
MAFSQVICPSIFPSNIEPNLEEKFLIMIMNELFRDYDLLGIYD